MNTNTGISKEIQEQLNAVLLHAEGHTFEQVREKFDEVMDDAKSQNDILFGSILCAEFLARHEKYDWALEQYQQTLQLAQSQIKADGDLEIKMRQKKILIYTMNKFANFLYDCSLKLKLEDNSTKKIEAELLYGAYGYAFQLNDIGLMESLHKNIVAHFGAQKVCKEAKRVYDEKESVSIDQEILVAEFYAYSLWEKGDKEEAIQLLSDTIHLDEKLKLKEDDVLARLTINKAKYLSKLEKDDKALEALESVIDLSCSTQVYALQLKCDLLFKLGRFEDAIHAAEKALLIAKTSDFRELEGLTVMALAALFHSNKQSEQGVELIDRYLAEWDPVKDKDHLARLDSLKAGILGNV